MVSKSAWILSRAKWRCLFRSLLPVVRANPVLAFLATLAFTALPLSLFWTGSRSGEVLATMARLDDRISALIVIMLGMVPAALGFTIQHMSSKGGMLDAQIRSAPLTRLELFQGTVGVFFTAACLGFLAISLILLGPIIYTAGAPLYALGHLMLFEAAIFYAAGVIGEVFVRLTHRQLSTLLAPALLVVVWLGAGALAGDTTWFGVTRMLGRLTLGPGGMDSLRLAAGLIFLLLTTVVVWVLLAGVLQRRPSRPFFKLGHGISFPEARIGTVVLATLKSAAREGALMRHVIFVSITGGVFSGLATTLLPYRIVKMQPGSFGYLGLLLLITTLGAAVVSLAIPGVNRGGGEWFWRSAPVGMTRYVLGVLIAAIVGGTLAVLVTGAIVVLPAIWAGTHLPEAHIMLTVGVTILLLASAAGFIVPYTLQSTPEQVLASTVFGALLAGTFATANWIVPRLMALGAQTWLVEAGLVSAVAGFSLAIALLIEDSRRST